MTKITKRTVDALRPKTEGRDQWLWDTSDGALKGFGVRMKPSGAASYLVQYRTKEGRTRRLVLGRLGEMTPDQARECAKEKLCAVRQGTDPSAERKSARQSITVSELCEIYLREGCATKKASTLETDKGRITRHIKPLIGNKIAASVTRADVEKARDAIASGRTKADVKTKKRGRAIVDGGKGTATRTIGLLGGIFSFAVTRGVRPDNPVRGVKRFPDRRNERFLSPIELARLGAALTEAESSLGIQTVAAAAIRLLVLTGCRKGEILTAKWDYVSFEHGVLALPDSKTGHKIIPLGAPARELLAKLPRVNGNPYVLPSVRGDGHLVDLSEPWAMICKAADLPGLRIHDLRHSFASVGASGGDGLVVVGKLLGHKDAKTTARYAHLAPDPLRDAADRISSRIAASMRGNETHGLPVSKEGLK